jgi:aspartate aminotransferase
VKIDLSSLNTYLQEGSFMFHLASKLALIKTSPTFAITKKVIEQKEKGVKIYGLGAGEPDFQTPDHIKQAGIEAIQKGLTKYTPVEGTQDLRKAIQAKFKKENGLDYGLDEIIVSSGGKQVLFNAFMASLSEGDEVIIPAPYWVSYPDMVLLAGGKPVIVQTTEANHFKLTADQLKKALTKQTKWIILNSPSNPTGMIYTKSELEALLEVVRSHPSVMIMSDDIYEHLTYDDCEFLTAAQLAPDLKDRILTMNGASKVFSMTGWRIGYAGGPKALIKAMVDVQGHSTSNPCSISQAACLAALNGDMSFLVEWKKVYVRRRDLVCAYLNDIPGMKVIKPQGAFYIFASCAIAIGKKTPSGKVIQTDEDFATYLLDDYGVALVHGAAFGLSPYFRISYATSDDVLMDACEAIQKAVAVLRV